MNQNTLPLIADGGFSAVKGLLGDRQCRIKTAYRYDQTHGEKFNGDKVVYGDAALIKSGSYCLQDIDDLVRYYPLFVHAVAKEFGINQAPVLGIGLPFEFWQQETMKSADGISNVIKVLETNLSNFEVGKHVYTFDKVVVLPQGLGATQAFLAKFPHCTGNTLSIDLGFNTVIWTLYSDDQKEIVYGETYYKRGVSDMAQNFIKPIISRLAKDKTYSPAEINQFIERGSIQIGFKTISIENDIKQSAEIYASRIIEQIMKDLKHNQGAISFRNVVFSGGGARFLNSMNNKNEDVTIHVAESPEMQNAIGFDLLVRKDFQIPKAA